MVGTHRYYGDSDPKSYKVVSGSLKTVQAEYGTSIPMHIDAADLEEDTGMVYLISGK